MSSLSIQNQSTMTRLDGLKQVIRPFVIFILAAFAITTLSRAGLVLWQNERLLSLSDLWHVFLFGVRIDLSSFCYWIAPAVLITFFIPNQGRIKNSWELLLRSWLVLGLVIIGFMESATPTFINEYDLRPNRLFVEYLEFPKEVLSMLWGGYKLELLLGTLVMLLLPRLAWHWLKPKSAPQQRGLNWLERLVGFVVIVFFVALGARGTLQHRPINPSFTSFSSDQLVNNLTLNSTYSVAFAIRAMRDEIDASNLYPRMNEKSVFSEVRQAMQLRQDQFTSAERPTLHHQELATSTLPRYKNLVIVLEESLGARFVGTLGGLPITPELDKLATEGWLFERLYATGTRSVRGIEAVITGFVPTPARSVVKLPRSQNNFFTLASALKAQGYDTSFIYGGEGHFDNMAGFFLGNGFERVVDQRDYENPKFIGSWGASDEDLFNKADQEFEQLQQQGKPFFSLVFSSSNHTPYEFPQDAISLYEQPPQTRNNAIKYADYALGQFFQKAKQSNYWDDTLFLIVADHDARVHGSDLVPIKHFRIPGLLIGKGMPSKRDARIFSQIDLAPTLLALLGIETEHPMIGQDITTLDANYQGRAIMQYDQNQAYMQGDQVVVMQPNKPTLQLSYDPSTAQLSPSTLDPVLEKCAVAHALWGSIAYKKGLYASAAAVQTPAQTAQTSHSETKHL